MKSKKHNQFTQTKVYFSPHVSDPTYQFQFIVMHHLESCPIEILKKFTIVGKTVMLRVKKSTRIISILNHKSSCLTVTVLIFNYNIDLKISLSRK